MGFNIPSGGSAKTKTPSITIVDNTSGLDVTFSITNNDAGDIVAIYELDDSTPDANALGITASSTSGNIQITGLTDGTSYTIYCFGTTAKKVQSLIASQGFTTPEIVYYELIADTEVTGSAVTSVTFSSLSISKTDDVVLVGSWVNCIGSSTYLYVNNNQTATNYYNQNIQASNTTVSGARSNASRLAYIPTSNAGTLSITPIKLTNDGYSTWQSHLSSSYIATADFRILDYFTTSTFTATSITQLDIVHPTANGIGIGSRFFLYKVVA